MVCVCVCFAGVGVRDTVQTSMQLDRGSEQAMQLDPIAAGHDAVPRPLLDMKDMGGADRCAASWKLPQLSLAAKGRQFAPDRLCQYRARATASGNADTADACSGSRAGDADHQTASKRLSSATP